MATIRFGNQLSVSTETFNLVIRMIGIIGTCIIVKLVRKACHHQIPVLAIVSLPL